MHGVGDAIRVLLKTARPGVALWRPGVAAWPISTLSRMEHPAVVVVMRTLHLFGAVVLFGGLLAVPMFVRPALRDADPATREAVIARVTRQLQRWLGWAAVALVVSGTYAWMMSAELYRLIGPVANALLGTKVLLAVLLITLLWAWRTGLTGSSPRAHRVVVFILLHLAIAIVILAAVLRQWRLDFLVG